MGKESGEPAGEAARRRLELLSEELVRAGLAPAPVDDPTPAPAGPEPDPVTPTVVPEPGRHARSRGTSVAGRVARWLHDRLPAALQGRVGLGGAHLALVALVLALGLAVAAVVVLRGSPEGELVPPARPAVLVDTAAPDATPSAAPSGKVVVDVAGGVRRPGVTSLPAGSRVVDAIRRAGGARRGVDLTSLNLARVLVDGEQILVGVEGAHGAAATAAPGNRSAGPLVNLNTASSVQLEALPGVGPVTAGKIVDWRTEHGAFTSVEDLLEVDGIGEKTLEEIAPHVTL